MHSPQSLLPPKRDVVLAFLGRGTLRVFVDARLAGVTVPRNLAQQAELVLRIGRTLNPAIPDLDVGDEAIACTLSFNRVPCWCRLPYEAIYAVVSDSDGRGVVWPDDVPIESQILQSAAPRRSPSARSRRPTRKSYAQARSDAAPTAEIVDRSGESTVAVRAPSPSRRRGSVELERPESAPISSRSSDSKTTSGSMDRAAVDRAAVDRAAVDRERLEQIVAASAPERASSIAGASASDDDAARPRRTLPPYLRVVK
jgi:stringent starvation protein B